MISPGNPADARSVSARPPDGELARDPSPSPALTPGLVSVSFRSRSPAEIVAAAAAAGLRAIEWGGDVHVPAGHPTSARAVAALTRDHGLEIAAYGSYYHAGMGAARDFGPVLDTALALGAPCIRVWAGRQGSAALDAAGRAAVVADLRRCAELAAAAGLRVAAEFHADTLMDTAASARAVLAEISHPALRTYWQPPHGLAAPEAVAGLRELLPWLEHVHVFHWWPAPRDRRPLAEGAERWRAFLAPLAEQRRARCALLEFMPRDTLAELPAEARSLRLLLG